MTPRRFGLSCEWPRDQLGVTLTAVWRGIGVVLIGIGLMPGLSLAQDSVRSGIRQTNTDRTARFSAAGLRKIPGRHLTLWTDLPPDPSRGASVPGDLPRGGIDEIPVVFDAAVPSWCRLLGISPDAVADWHMTGFVMRDARTFSACGAFPSDLPPFPHGFQRGPELWIYEQPSADYRRHLVLHEGVHGLMKAVLGAAGPPWYAEGMAERLATHRIVGTPGGWTVETGLIPSSRDGFSMWGRTRILREDFAAKKALMPETVLLFGSNAHREVRAYAWSWAMCQFLAAHPTTAEAFADLTKHTSLSAEAMANHLIKAVGPAWPTAREDWQVFIAELDFGFDLERGVTRRKPARPLRDGGAETVFVDAAAAWQSSGLTVEPGTTLTVRAEGTVTLATEPVPWPVTAAGVTLDYYAGRPIGRLLMAVTDESRPLAGPSPLLRPIDLGEAVITPAGATLTIPQGGTIFFRINDAPSSLADNTGTLTITIQ